MNERKRKEKERFEQKKNSPSKLQPLKFTIVPRKYKSPLHKKMEKLTAQYDKFRGSGEAARCPLKCARILKQAISTDKRIKKQERRIVA